MKYDACVDCGVEKTGSQRRRARCRGCANHLSKQGKSLSPETRRAMSLAKGGPGTRNHFYWASAVKERDCWRCICGYQGVKGKKDVDAHHIVPKESIPWGKTLRRVVENGITLCRSCHRFVHGAQRPAHPALAPLFDSVQQHSRCPLNSPNLNSLAPSAALKDVSPQVCQ